MTNINTPVDNTEELLSLMSATTDILLDFDGPVCSVFAGYPASIVADQLRDVLREGYDHIIPGEVEHTDDPFDVLSYSWQAGNDDARYVEAALKAYEVQAVATAMPTAGSHTLIKLLQKSGRTVSIVSNNSTISIQAYLDHHRLSPYINFVAGREEANPDLLKPNPHLIAVAISGLNIGPATKFVMIGDSSTDIEAASAAKIPAIAFANKPNKLSQFAELKPHSIITNLDPLVETARWLTEEVRDE